MTLTIPIRVVSEANMREHWAAKANRVRSQRRAVALAWRAAQAANDNVPALPVAVTLVRISPRPLDDDNLRGALKGIRDQLAVELGLPVNRRGIADDRDPRVTWLYGQERGKPGEYAVRVVVEARS